MILLYKIMLAEYRKITSFTFTYLSTKQNATVGNS